jgi:hypothetical protein
MVLEPTCFFGRQIPEKLQHLRTERNLNRLTLTRAFACFQFIPNGIKRKMRWCEDFAGQPLGFTNQPSSRFSVPD